MVKIVGPKPENLLVTLLTEVLLEKGAKDRLGVDPRFNLLSGHSLEKGFHFLLSLCSLLFELSLWQARVGELDLSATCF